LRLGRLREWQCLRHLDLETAVGGEPRRHGDALAAKTQLLLAERHGVSARPRPDPELGGSRPHHDRADAVAVGHEFE
jgi:hypothetical protein